MGKARKDEVKPVAPEEHIDRYSCFAELSGTEREGIDYRIRARSGHSGTLIMAPHGGEIEPGTSEIARAVAAEVHSFYSFEGMKARGNRFLHIKSTEFDEPRGVQLAGESQTVVAIHGCKGKEALVYMGGRNTLARERIQTALEQAGFSIAQRAGLLGQSARNLCNRTANGSGVQLELTTALRIAMFEDLTNTGRKKTTEVFQTFVTALSESLNGHGPRSESDVEEAKRASQIGAKSEC